jgi:hypothetical protein
MKKGLIILAVLAALAAILYFVLKEKKAEKPKPGEVYDEAYLAGRTPESLPGSADDYLRDMDYGLTKDPEAARAALEPYYPGITATEAVDAIARGRNNWTIWTAGNDRLWDELSRLSFGNLDLLKTLSNHPAMAEGKWGYSRDNRWEFLGLVNEPCFKKGTGPREDRFDLWLDVRDPDCEYGPDPFEDEEKYPGVEIGARGKNIPVGSYYGYASGIVGLRLFPNPDFDEAAQKHWNAEKYYTDPNYYNNKDLVKPYRVGMSCGFCHVGPNPTNPPEDLENPKWENLNNNPGAQYFWIDRIFQWKVDPSDFIYQLFHTSRPGALDTSLVSSDQINNPRTMNAVYSVGARAGIAAKWGKEHLSGGELNNKQFSDYVPPLPDNSPLMGLYQNDGKTVLTPRVLKDGADSVGILGALNRVYINIGLFSEEWLLHFIPLIGGADITPIPIATLNKNSVYWQANETQTIDTALFFLATAQPDLLANAPGGEAHLTQDEAQLKRGKEVFAQTCARCHSSKLPEKAFTDFFPDHGCVEGYEDKNYLDCFEDYWQWTKTDEFKDAMTEIALADDFATENYFSTELRIPVTLLETNACSPLATNAIAGDIWNDFSSSSYKKLPAVGSLLIHDPRDGTPKEYVAPGGGRGYTRVPSLISVWSTAPYLLNNTVGDFYWTGTVDDRVAAFDDGIRKMLWPETRKGERNFVTRSGKEIPGVIDRTTERTFLKIARGFLPDFLQLLVKEEVIELGPIPAGTPVGLLTNIDLKVLKDANLLDKVKAGKTLLHDLKAIPDDASDEEVRAAFGNLVDTLLAVSKCPDFVVNRGHYFGTEYLPDSEGETPLSDADKEALIEFLKTI